MAYIFIFSLRNPEILHNCSFLLTDTPEKDATFGKVYKGPSELKFLLGGKHELQKILYSHDVGCGCFDAVHRRCLC